MKNKIILVGGYCAAGKSTFANKLSQILNIPCFNKDIIKETLGDGFGSESGEVFKKGSKTTFMLMLHIAERFLQAGQICILESNFVLEEIRDIKRLLEKYNGECMLFIFKGDLDIMYERYAERDETGKRHWVHKKVGDRDGFKNVMSGWLGLEEAEIEQKIVIDATLFDNINYENLFNAAKKFIEEKNNEK